MNLLRTVITSFRRNHNEIDALTPRLLDDAGIEGRGRRGLISSMLSSFTPRGVVEIIRDRS